MDITPPTLLRTIKVTSSAFAEGGSIPARFTCKGAGPSPDLTWTGVPAGATALAVVVSDPDAPRGTFLHWLVTGLPARDGRFPEGSALPGSLEGINSTGRQGWCPPCPPSGRHRYIFALHALDAPVGGSSSQRVIDDIAAHTIAWGSLTGLVSAS